MTAYWCQCAWLPDGIADSVLVNCDDSGTITKVSVVDAMPSDAFRLPGLVLPGFANAHSHAFHRALRGRTHGGGGTFWTWREAMYQLAGRLDPAGYYRLARAVYAEMVVAGFSRVGEFHYLHHGPGGKPYTDPNEMNAVLVAAARDAGIRITLLDACYLSGGIGQPLLGEQLRFGDGDVAGWSARVSDFVPDGADVLVGAAIHSVRAVPAEALSVVAEHARGRGVPLHVHLSEQPAENAACLAAYGRTPTELLAEHGVFDAATTVVHATHLSATDISLLGQAGVSTCLCPTTEADLADGIGPAHELMDAGCVLSLGSDQHAVIDPFIELRALEHDERLRSGQRGQFSPEELLAAATTGAHASLGDPIAGRIATGAPADLVAVRTDTSRTAGSLPEQVILAANSSDVDTVVIGGKVIATDGQHTSLGDVGQLLARTIAEVWE